MNFLITAGNTQTPIDRVRCITNIFTGKTGTMIALEALRRGHCVSFLTSHPEVVHNLVPDFAPETETWEMHPYRTFEDLQSLMEQQIPNGHFDVIIHCAAVSDYHLEGVYIPSPGTAFNSQTQTWNSLTHQPTLIDVNAGKVKSHHSDLWLRMTPTPKLVDAIRQPWGFTGTLVKFKLEVNLSDSQLVEVAKQSRLQSDADLIVANTLEGMNRIAFLVDREEQVEEVVRFSLPRRLLERVENMKRE